MRAAFRFGRVFGIPIGAHASWLLVFLLLTWLLGAGWFPQRLPGQPAGLLWLGGLLTSLAFFACVVLHELGHALVALREGVAVRQITLFVFGGVAEIEGDPKTPGAELRIAIAGPLVSISLGVLFLLLWRGLRPLPVLAVALEYLGWINLLLGAFNLVPGFPLDGGRVLRAVLWGVTGSLRRAARWSSLSGRLVGFGFIVVGSYRLLVHGLLDGLWLVFIGWFLNNAAEVTYRQLVLRETLAGVVAGDVVERDCPVVSRRLELNRLIDEELVGGAREAVAVADSDDDGGGVAGLVGLRQAAAVPRQRRPFVTAEDVMTPLAAIDSAADDEPAWDVLQRMSQAGLAQLPVLRDGAFLGLLTRERLARYIQVRTALEEG